jgi:hypothetical protein
MLIIVVGSVRQKRVEDLEIEYTLERDSSIYLELAINQMLRKVLLIIAFS